jgi:hypothetical protein
MVRPHGSKPKAGGSSWALRDKVDHLLVAVLFVGTKSGPYLPSGEFFSESGAYQSTCLPRSHRLALVHLLPLRGLLRQSLSQVRVRKIAKARRTPLQMILATKGSTHTGHSNPLQMLFFSTTT